MRKKIFNEVSRADSGIKKFIKSDVFETESVSKMSDFINLLTRLSAEENFADICCREWPTEKAETCSSYDIHNKDIDMRDGTK